MKNEEWLQNIALKPNSGIRKEVLGLRILKSSTTYIKKIKIFETTNYIYF